MLWMVITFQKDVIAPKQHRTSNRSSNRSSNQSLHSSHQFSIGSEHSVNGESIKGKLKKNKTDTAAPKAIAKPLLVKDDRPAPSTYSRISGNNKVAPDVVGTTIIGMLSQKAVKLSTTINSDSESLSLPALQADAHVESGGNALPEESMLKDCPPGTETVIENDEEEEEIGKEEEDEGDGEEANLNDLKEDGTLTLNRVESCYVQEENLLPQDCVPQTVEELEELMAVYNSSFKFGHDEIWRRSFTMSREVEGEPVKDNTIRTAIATAADRALFNV